MPRSIPKSGHRVSYDGAKKRKGNKVPFTVTTLSHLLSTVINPTNNQKWVQVGELCQQVKEILARRWQLD